jgi:hypothetical protein
VCIDATLKYIERVISYFQKYNDKGTASSIEIVEAIASDMEIKPKCPPKYQSKRNKHFDENQ